MKTEKFWLSSVPASASSHALGSRQSATIVSPAPVYAILFGTPTACTTGTRPITSIEMPRMNATACAVFTPWRVSSAPSAIATSPPIQRRFRRLWAGGSGRLRIAVTMFSRLTRQAETTTTTKVSSTPTV